MSTGIPYLDRSWNPIAMRCTPAGEGCARCWHLAMAARLAANPRIPADQRAAYAGKAPPLLVESRLRQPLGWKAPQHVGVEYMGDWCHEAIGWEGFLALMQTMRLATQHTYYTLTKRPAMLSERLARFWGDWPESPRRVNYPHLWLGVSVWNQSSANLLIPQLLAIGWPRSWVSIEPLLAPLVLRPDWLERLGWVVIGAESGAGARDCDPVLVAALIDQCVPQVPVYYKQGLNDRGDWEHMPTFCGRVWDQMPERSEA